MICVLWCFVLVLVVVWGVLWCGVFVWLGGVGWGLGLGCVVLWVGVFGGGGGVMTLRHIETTLAIKVIQA